MSNERSYPTFHEFADYYSSRGDDEVQERPVCPRYPNCQGDGDESCEEFQQFKGDTACGTCYHEKECHVQPTATRWQI